MLVETVLALVRHGLTAGGAYFVTEGVATTMDMNTFVGAIVTAGGLGWSMWRKWKRARA